MPCQSPLTTCWSSRRWNVSSNTSQIWLPYTTCAYSQAILEYRRQTRIIYSYFRFIRNYKRPTLLRVDRLEIIMRSLFKNSTEDTRRRVQIMRWNFQAWNIRTVTVRSYESMAKAVAAIILSRLRLFSAKRRFVRIFGHRVQFLYQISVESLSKGWNRTTIRVQNASWPSLQRIPIL